MLIPIGDDNPSARTPYVTYGLIALNLLVFLVANVFAENPNRLAGAFDLPQEIAKSYGLMPARAEWFMFLTSVFLHANLLHLVGNMLFLWIAGDNVEDKLGHLPYLGFYLLAGVLASGAYMLFTKGGGLIPLVGASGAIAGAMGAYLVLFPRAKIRIFYWFYFFIGVFLLEARWALGIWIAQNLFMWFVMDTMTGVAYAAHAGGFAVGVAVAMVAKNHLRGAHRVTQADRLTGFADRRQPPPRKEVRTINAEPEKPSRPTRPTRPTHKTEFVSPRTETDRSGDGFFGAEEAIASNVKEARLDVALDKYEDYLRMRHAKPLPPWAQVEIAAEYFRRGNHERALNAYRRYLSQNPAGVDAAEAKFRLGIILSRHRQEYYRAREYLLQASMEHPNAEIVGFAKQELDRIKSHL